MKTSVNDFQIEEMESFPPNSNPFNHDCYHMGTYIGDSDICMMFEKHRGNKYVILVHIPTGKRIHVTLPKEI